MNIMSGSKISQSAIGTIIATHDSPSSRSFTFVVTKETFEKQVHRGSFIQVISEETTVLGVIDEIQKTNRYFARAESVREFERQGRSLTSIFPADRWEFLSAQCRSLGVITKAGIQRANFPVSPGATVYLAEEELLIKFLGLDIENGMHLGAIPGHKIPGKFNLTRLIQKHVAILAISGGGKSYLTSVLIEELLTRERDQGRPAVVLFDTHGEFRSLAEKTIEGLDLSSQIHAIPSALFQIATPKLSAFQIAAFQPAMSQVQTRDLNKVINSMFRAYKKPYTIEDVIKEVELDETINTRTKEALSGWLYTLAQTRLFSHNEHPNLQETIQAGKLLIIDLSGHTSLRSKQMIVAYTLNRIFEMRRKDLIPPTSILIEEAHQFCPDSAMHMAISRSIIETIAREGRKFFTSLVLISQRPINLSTTALSQMNTHIILRIVNPYDLDYIGRSSEGITRELLNQISTLGVGEALISGAAVNMPLFLRIRPRKTLAHSSSIGFAEACKRYD
ncbi:MAG: ATP-binding protein [Candidatus Kariarchaeaceae archaeon]